MCAGCRLALPRHDDTHPHQQGGGRRPPPGRGARGLVPPVWAPWTTDGSASGRTWRQTWNAGVLHCHTPPTQTDKQTHTTNTYIHTHKHKHTHTHTHTQTNKHTQKHTHTHAQKPQMIKKVKLFPKIYNTTTFCSKTHAHALAHTCAHLCECVYSVARSRVCTVFK